MVDKKASSEPACKLAFLSTIEPVADAKLKAKICNQL
jgi:hypothetical protein